jgi:hypothetical protein
VLWVTTPLCPRRTRAGTSRKPVTSPGVVTVAQANDRNVEIEIPRLWRLPAAEHAAGARVTH